MSKEQQLQVAAQELQRLMDLHRVTRAGLKEEMIQLYYLSRQPHLIPTEEIDSLANTFVEWEGELHDLTIPGEIEHVAMMLFDDIIHYAKAC